MKYLIWLILTIAAFGQVVNPPPGGGGGGGTITGVTAGTGLSGGGTSGTVTLNSTFNPAAPGTIGGTTPGIGDFSVLNLASGNVLNWNGDSSISRLAADSLAIGNGTAGDFSGSLKFSGNSIIYGLGTGISGTLEIIGGDSYSQPLVLKQALSQTGEFISFLGTTGNALSMGVSFSGGSPINYEFANDSGLPLLLINNDGSGLRTVGRLGWSSGVSVGTVDTSISRLGADSLAIGNGTAGDTTGTVTTAAVLPGILYSAAGTPLPSCASGIKGEQAVVSDATTPLYMVAYSSGGTITAAVICSYNGSTYAWLTH